MSLAHAGFYGIGAYTTAILSTQFGFTFWLSIPLAMLISGAIAFIVSLIALRTVEDYFIICTLGIQVILFSIMNNWMGLTRGPLGIPGIPSISLFGFSLDSKISFLTLSLFFVTFVWFVLRNISKSGFGKTLTAISEDEIYTQSIGKNVYLSKTVSFTMSAMFAAIPGTLYAHYISYIDPTSFTVNESIFVLSIVIIGGLGNLTGSFLAATFLVLLPEALRFVGMPNSIAANMRQIIYGLILVVVMMTGKKGVKELFMLKTPLS
ncbi:MAG: branched-chain amino acid ABC transporter permease [Bacteroidetes bacterium RIFCSPLOWO2_02_FULL_36_8]|nr:MAG: branched-chain amino acid ABC transporter permease [Bacteroidetes bacterium RIFCSPLOWO2_02_FULL_36_8]OFY71039.1 MAG: branched-chain amino acid ABC transporter permease [Bacteroidetes bacterium RIFCSPLOWO2_12_FULL_37_12]